jgi:CheY-like chemotaxis protein
MTPKLTVLVVDDSEELRQLVKHCLEALGHLVICVENGREAIKALRKRYFDLVVTDILMPDGDGLEVIIEAKKRGGSTRIIVMTGGGVRLESSYLVKLAKTMGAHVTILKPFRRARFIEAVNLAVQPLAVRANERSK